MTSESGFSMSGSRSTSRLVTNPSSLLPGFPSSVTGIELNP